MTWRRRRARGPGSGHGPRGRAGSPGPRTWPHALARARPGPTGPPPPLADEGCRGGRRPARGVARAASTRTRRCARTDAISRRFAASGPGPSRPVQAAGHLRPAACSPAACSASNGKPPAPGFGLAIEFARLAGWGGCECGRGGEVSGESAHCAPSLRHCSVLAMECDRASIRNQQMVISDAGCYFVIPCYTS